MSKVDEFVELFKKRVSGKHPNDFKANPKALSVILSHDHELGDLFQEAVEEATSPEAEAAAGLSNLFPT